MYANISFFIVLSFNLNSNRRIYIRLTVFQQGFENRGAHEKIYRISNFRHRVNIRSGDFPHFSLLFTEFCAYFNSTLFEQSKSQAELSYT